jgi:CheY-like chemotaxis protein
MNNNPVAKSIAKLPLSAILITPLVVQIIAIVGLSGYLSFHNNQKTDSNNASGTIILCLGALGVTTAWGFYTSRWIVKPINKLKTAADAIAAGKLEQQIEVHSTKELNALAESFNMMSQDLKKSFSYLENINEELEARVEEKGVELHAAQKAKEIAENTNKNQGNFLGTMSRQLRNPLNDLLDYAQNLQSNLTEVNEIAWEEVKSHQVKGLKFVEQQSNRLLTLIDEIVDFAQLEVNQIKLHPSSIHFPSLLKEVVAPAKLQAKEKNLTFEYEMSRGMPSNIKADKKRLQQLLSHLLSHAIESAGEGKVNLTISEIESIPSKSAELLPQKIIRFEIVNRGSDRASQDDNLSNMSLAFSERILALMDSELKINHQAKGSMFWFDVTFSVTDGIKELKQDEVSELLSSHGKKRKILIVDDIEENRTLLIDILEPMGFELFTASNGREGIELACKHRPDLILTDLFMGVKTGFSMVEELRQMPTFATLPIIAISASSFEVVEQKSKESGCDTFLQKPFDQKQLLSLLVQYLQLEWVDSETETSFFWVSSH